MVRSGFAVLLLACPASALAVDAGWSVGTSVGTRFVPNAYPIAFPTRIGTYDFDGDGEGDDVNADGTPDVSTLERVRGDVYMSLELNRDVLGLGRLGVVGTLDSGTRFNEAALLFTYDKTLDFQALMVLVGGGFGFGTATWRGLDEDERLKVSSYPLRAQAGIVQPLFNGIALQGRVFGQITVPSSHTYWDLAGQEQEVSGFPLLYTTIGLQFGVTFDVGPRGVAADVAPEEAEEAAAPAEPPAAPAPAEPPPASAPPPAAPTPASGAPAPAETAPVEAAPSGAR